MSRYSDRARPTGHDQLAHQPSSVTSRPAPATHRGHDLGPELNALNAFVENDPLGRELFKRLRAHWAEDLFGDVHAWLSDQELRVYGTLCGRTFRWRKLVEHVSADQLVQGYRSDDRTLVTDYRGVAVLRPVLPHKGTVLGALDGLRRKRLITAFSIPWGRTRQRVYAPIGLYQLVQELREAADVAYPSHQREAALEGTWRNVLAPAFALSLDPAEPPEEYAYCLHGRRCAALVGEPIPDPPADARASSRKPDHRHRLAKVRAAKVIH